MRTRKAVLDVSILPDFDDKLLLDVVDNGLGAVSLPNPKGQMLARKVSQAKVVNKVYSFKVSHTDNSLSR